jgi:hypothetical protein
MFLPRDPTRRRFLAVAAVSSIVAGGSLAVAESVSQAVALSSASPSAALLSAVAELARAHAGLLAAEAKNDAAEDVLNAWQRSHPVPKSKRAKRKWVKKFDAYHRKITPEGWQALMAAELVFADAQCAVALVSIESAADLHGIVVASPPSLTGGARPRQQGPDRPHGRD